MLSVVILRVVMLSFVKAESFIAILSVDVLSVVMLNLV